MKINSKEKRDNSQDFGRESVSCTGRLNNKRWELAELMVSTLRTREGRFL